MEGVSNLREGFSHDVGIGEAYSGFWWGNLRKRDPLGD